MIDSRVVGSEPMRCSLEIETADQTQRIDENRPSATIGRQHFNDIVVSDDQVSRFHARIEYRRGKFYLMDRSTNGTYIQNQDQDGIYLHHDEIQLIGSGIIGVGKEVEFDSPLALYFSVEFRPKGGNDTQYEKPE